MAGFYALIISSTHTGWKQDAFLPPCMIIMQIVSDKKQEHFKKESF